MLDNVIEFEMLSSDHLSSSVSGNTTFNSDAWSQSMFHIVVVCLDDRFS